ncbi:unnamed protein product [Prunus armeniaca]|uniref:Uncharacterized protein n=1 Tax=Prunus armeniaca TaxID=36596 RepID=A0A6J5XUA8_PRUAR|nr:unnamed protein product [Prunus armeniaca]
MEYEDEDEAALSWFWNLGIFGFPYGCSESEWREDGLEGAAVEMERATLEFPMKCPALVKPNQTKPNILSPKQNGAVPASSNPEVSQALNYIASPKFPKKRSSRVLL